MLKPIPTLLMISAISLAFSIAAMAESDLAREIREAKGLAQQRQKQSLAQSAEGLSQARKKTVVAILAAHRLRAIAIESEGYSENEGGVLLNAKLSDGRVCQARVTDEPFVSHAGEGNDSSSSLESNTERAKKQLAAARRLSDAAQTKRALARIAQGNFLDEVRSGLRTDEVEGLVRRVNAYLLEASISQIDALVNCYNASGSSKELHGVAMANKNGAILGVD